MKRYVHTIDVVFVLVLFCVFSMSLLFVLMSGARAYHGIKSSLEEQYSSHTCVSYLSAKLKHYDNEGAVRVGELDGVTALCLSEYFDDREYITYIYYDNGYVKELFADAILEFTAEDGSNIIAVQNLEFVQVEDNLIYIECTGTNDNALRLYISLRSEGRPVS